jgi:hypothetical protein
LTERDSGWMSFKQGFTLVEASAQVTPQQFATLRQALANVPPQLGKVLLADLEARKAGKRAEVVPACELLRILDVVEKAGYYDLWLAGYLWRQTGRSDGDDAGRIALYQRLALHVRRTNALLKARARGQHVLLPPRAWMSKAGPRPAERAAQQAALKAITEAANGLLGTAGLGTWQRDGLVPLTVEHDSGPADWIEEGARRPLKAGQSFRWQRLDLVQTGDKALELHHAGYGKLTLPASKLVSVWQLPGYLSDEAARKVERDVTEALKGDEEAAGRLEKALPLTHACLRERLAAQPGARGAARLRLILSLFDDTVVRLPDPAPAPALPGALGAINGRVRPPK